jgi:hypothetical protein
MREITIAQDNRLTSARYELSLIEKRVFYYIIKEVRNKYLAGTVQRTLFDDMNLKINLSDLAKGIKQEDNKKEAKKALKSLRVRSFEWDNGTPEDSEEHEWFEVGFINKAKIKNGVAEIVVDKDLMPFLVELSGQFTPYSLNVAMSLKSKWSQRMYELCQKWHGTDGFRISVEELRNSFMLDGKYKMYAKFKENVLDTPKRELKALYDIGQCDVYFEFSEERNGRSVESLRFKLFRKNSMNVKTTHDMLLELIPVFASLFNILKMPKNDAYIKEVILQLQKHPNLIEPLNTRVRELLANGIKDDTQRYVRFVLNEDVLGYEEKPVKEKKVAKNEQKTPNNAMLDILNLANTKKMD